MRSRLTGILLAGVLAISVPAAALAYAPHSAPAVDTTASTCVHSADYTAMYVYWQADAGKPRTIQVDTYLEWRVLPAWLKTGYIAMGDGQFHDSFTVTLSNRVGSDTETITCPPRT
ncbi:MAG TPA: hypothetical protein VFY23_16315 [Candidatus Limnocylindrales bacterium]|nr:hypothetical protein [Candidatus Limnocylindrales bacterium]